MNFSRRFLYISSLICLISMLMLYSIYYNIVSTEAPNSEVEAAVKAETVSEKNANIKVFFYNYYYPNEPQIVKYQLENEHIGCEWIRSSNWPALVNIARNNSISTHQSNKTEIIVGMYEVHSLYHRLNSSRPLVCQLPANISMFINWEVYCRFPHIVDAALPHFDGYISAHPQSDVQLLYDELQNLIQFPVRNFSSLYKGASYGASDCHEQENNFKCSTKRDSVVVNLTQLGLRVDSFGKCLHSEKLPEEIEQLTKVRDYENKKKILNHYAFYLAFENSREEGYISEKVFDGLRAGTVPVYFGGDSVFLKSLIPHPKAVIFVDDFSSSQHLVRYLSYLLTNETAYEEHREWRKTWNREKFVADKPLLRKGMDIRVCEWAANQYQLLQQSEMQKKKGQEIIKHKIGNRACRV